MSVIERERVEVVAPARTVADDLNLAADLLESGEWGWCQKQARSGDDLCMLGAVAIATGHVLAENHQYLDIYEARYRDALHALDRVGPRKAAWNDTPGRTKEEVVAKLREAAEAAA